jgi:hypothetical protein
MTITLIIIGYILNVFLNRWLNYIIYKKSGTKAPFIWFLSLIGTGTLLIVIVINDVNKQNWFTGKYWKKK